MSAIIRGNSLFVSIKWSIFLSLLWVVGIHSFGSILDDITCYDQDIENGVLEINDDPESPPRGKSIFFHETSCRSAGNFAIVITPRQACAVESAARLHPERPVYLLYSSPIRSRNVTLPSEETRNILSALDHYENIKIRSLNLQKYVENTPLEGWYLKGKLSHSHYAVSHASDLLRYVTLWKYGGTYMDLDVVVMKNMDRLQYNFVGMANSESIGAGVLNFEPYKFGHKLAESCLRDIKINFLPRRFTHNGPRVIKRILMKVCSTRLPSQWSAQECKGFQVLHQSAFYPIRWQYWQQYFNPHTAKEVLKHVSDSYVVHVWNRVSHDTLITSRSKRVAYAVLAQKYCPRVYTKTFNRF